MSKKQKIFTLQEKARIALSAIKGEKTMAQISSESQTHPTQIGLWKKQALESLPDLFKNDKKKKNKLLESIVKNWIICIKSSANVIRNWTGLKKIIKYLIHSQKVSLI